MANKLTWYPTRISNMFWYLIYPFYFLQICLLILIHYYKNSSISATYCSDGLQFTIRGFYRCWRLLLSILRSWYFRLRYASSRRLPIHAPTSNITPANKEEKIAIRSLTIARHVMHLEDSVVKTAAFGWVAILLSRKDFYKNWRDRSPCIISSGFNESHFVRTAVDRGSNIATRHLPCKCKDYAVRVSRTRLFS